MKKILARLFPLALLMIVIGACGSQNPDLAPTPAPPDVDAVRASETPVPPVAATTPRITRQVGTATPLMPTLTPVPTTGAATRRAIDATPIPQLASVSWPSRQFDFQFTSVLVGPRFANDVFVVNNLAYVTDSHDGLQIVDVSSPSTPLLLGGIETLGRAESVGVSENIAYVAANGLWTFRPLDSQGSDGTHRVLWKRVR
ncbi:MAG: hypothetical protein CL744_01190 [Chloroflexi bacterium]|nr:hypothetical protein [Chloroflexota bacterium]